MPLRCAVLRSFTPRSEGPRQDLHPGTSSAADSSSAPPKDLLPATGLGALSTEQGGGG